MQKPGELQKPVKTGALRKDQPLADDQVRCSCGDVFTANPDGVFTFPVQHQNHSSLTWARCFPPKGDDGPPK